MRPAELARDDTPMFPVITHALAHAESGGPPYDLVVLLDPTSPGRLPEEIDQAVEQRGRGDLQKLLSSGDTWTVKA
jgi:N-acylneuraminate cytidylyltransferase